MQLLPQIFSGEYDWDEASSCMRFCHHVLSQPYALSFALFTWVICELGMMSPVLALAIVAQVFMGSSYVSWRTMGSVVVGCGWLWFWVLSLSLSCVGCPFPCSCPGCFLASDFVPSGLHFEVCNWHEPILFLGRLKCFLGTSNLYPKCRCVGWLPSWHCGNLSLHTEPNSALRSWGLRFERLGVWREYLQFIWVFHGNFCQVIVLPPCQSSMYLDYLDPRNITALLHILRDFTAFEGFLSSVSRQ